MDDELYIPIACSLHDLLEAAATTGRPVTLRYATDSGDAELGGERILDWFAREGVEYLRLSSGLVLRMDRILTLNGASFAPRSR